MATERLSSVAERARGTRGRGRSPGEGRSGLDHIDPEVPKVGNFGNACRPRVCPAGREASLSSLSVHTRTEAFPGLSLLPGVLRKGQRTGARND